MAEHHFQPEGTELIPNLLMMAMHLCGVTKNLRIGSGEWRQAGIYAGRILKGAKPADLPVRAADGGKIGVTPCVTPILEHPEIVL